MLCNIGYRVNTSYGNTLYSANNTTYAGSQCPGLWVAGVNDGISGLGTYSIVTISGTPVPFSGSTILGNDFNATGGFECLQDVYGNGSVSTSSGTTSTTITYTPLASFTGTALLRYIPKTTGGNRGNITYVYIRVNSANCTASPCNMVMNGNMESGVNCGQMGYDSPAPSIDCWNKLIASPDYYNRGCVSPSNTGMAVPAIPPVSSPPTDTWSGPGSGNDAFLGLWRFSAGHEAMQTTLTTPIQPGNTYTISFWAKVSSNFMFSSNNPSLVMFRGGTAPLVPLPPLTPFTSVGTFLKDTLVKNDSLWHFHSMNFTYTGVVPLSELFIGNVTTTPNYVFIDDVKLVPAGITAIFTPPATAMYGGSVLTDLEQYVNPAGGNLFRSWRYI